MKNSLDQFPELEADELLIARLLDATVVPEDARRRLQLRLWQLADRPVPGEPWSSEAADLPQDAIPTAGPIASTAVVDLQPVVDPDPSVAEVIRLPARRSPRRVWMAVMAVSASALLGLIGWSAFQPLTPLQLVTICAEQLEQSANDWEVLDGEGLDGKQATDVVAPLAEVLGKFLRVQPEGELESRVLDSTRVAARGRLWRFRFAKTTSCMSSNFVAAPRSTGLFAAAAVIGREPRLVDRHGTLRGSLVCLHVQERPEEDAAAGSVGVRKGTFYFWSCPRFAFDLAHER